MKIKKKEYQKQLDDKYWDGVKVGMEFALDHPEEAKNCLNRLLLIRNTTEKLLKAFEPVSDAIAKVFGERKND